MIHETMERSHTQTRPGYGERRLSRDVEYSEYILPVCLPDPADPEQPDFYEGVKGLVVGWGWIKNRSGTTLALVDSGP